MSKRRVLAALAILSLGFIRASWGQAGASGYHLLRTIPIGGLGKWDYVVFDSAAHRLFVAHETKVEVVDLMSGKVTGQIDSTDGVHGIVLEQALHRGFTSNGDASTVSIFDLGTLRPLGRVPVTGADPDAILLEPVTHRIFTMNADSANATAIDAATGRVAGTIALGGAPESGVADGHGLLYINLEDKAALVTVDARSLKVIRTVPLAPCQRPTGMAIDQTTRRLFIGCRSRIMTIVDADKGTVLTTLPIGDRVDGGAFDPGTGFAFASNGDGTLTVVGPDGPAGYRIVETVKTRYGAKTMALDPASHEIYLVTANFGATPAATAAEPHPRPEALPGTFMVMVYGR